MYISKIYFCSLSICCEQKNKCELVTTTKAITLVLFAP
jgi:hypothetical protein